MIEKDFDIPFISDLALHEKRIQQNYRPIIAVHKWFARRPGTLFRGLLLSEFANGNLKDNFYKAHNLNKLKIADPFMVGGHRLLKPIVLGATLLATILIQWRIGSFARRLRISTWRHIVRRQLLFKNAWRRKLAPFIGLFAQSAVLQMPTSSISSG